MLLPPPQRSQPVEPVESVDISVIKAEEDAVPLSNNFVGDNPKKLAGALLKQVLPPGYTSKIPLKEEIPVQILFENGSAKLLDSNKSNRDKLAEIAREFNALGNEIKQTDNLLLINGHTDSVGHYQTNRRLSKARAQAVRNFLIKNTNIPPDRLIVKGYGAKYLLDAPDDTPQKRANNRRVGFKVVAPQEIEPDGKETRP